MWNILWHKKTSDLKKKKRIKLKPSDREACLQIFQPWLCSLKRSASWQTAPPEPCRSACWLEWGRAGPAPAAARCRQSLEKTRGWCFGRRWTGAHLARPQCATACSYAEPWREENRYIICLLPQHFFCQEFFEINHFTLNNNTQKHVHYFNTLLPLPMTYIMWTWSTHVDHFLPIDFWEYLHLS